MTLSQDNKIRPTYVTFPANDSFYHDFGLVSVGESGEVQHILQEFLKLNAMLIVKQEDEHKEILWVLSFRIVTGNLCPHL